MKKDSTEIQYVNVDNLIYLKDGIEKVKFLGIFKRKRAKHSLYRIIRMGSRFGATMEVGLQNEDSLEMKTIKVSPNRWVTYYTEESF